MNLDGDHTRQHLWLDWQLDKGSGAEWFVNGQKINTKSYWLAVEYKGRRRTMGAAVRSRRTDQYQGPAWESHPYSVLIQSDTEQRSAIVHPHWCCQSNQCGTAGGCTRTQERTYMHANLGMILFPRWWWLFVTDNKLLLNARNHVTSPNRSTLSVGKL